MMAPGRFTLLHPLPSPATVFTALLLLALFLVAMHFADPEPLALGIGLALMLAGVLVRLAGIGVLRKNSAAYREGPYAVCRHPMYAGTITLAAGIAAALDHAAAIAVPVAAIAVSLYRIRKEESYLESRFPDYAQYRDEVPAFPTPGSLARALKAGRLRFEFSLRQCFLNGEVFRVNLYLPLLLASESYLERLGRLAPHLPWLEVGGGLSVALACASVWLHPPESNRSRLDYVVPGISGLAVLLIALAE